MLKDRGEPVPTWQCIVKYLSWLVNCKVGNDNRLHHIDSISI